MSDTLVFKDQNVIADAGCIFNLLRSVCAPAIIGCFEPCLFIPLDVKLAVRDAMLENLLETQALQLTDLESEQEYSRYLALAYTGLHNEEAACISIAASRQWGIATDEKSVQRAFREFAPTPQIMTTAGLVKGWADTGATKDDVAKAIALIERDAGYCPPAGHPLYDWWKSCK